MQPLIASVTLALLAGCKNDGKLDAMPEASSDVATGAESTLPSGPSRKYTVKPELKELDLAKQDQIDGFLNLLNGEENHVIIYFHIHDKEHRYSDYYAWVRQLKEGYDYSVSGHGSAITRRVISNRDDLLTRIAADNSKYSPVDLMHFVAYKNPNAEQDGADQPATAPQSTPEGDSKAQWESGGRSQ